MVRRPVVSFPDWFPYKQPHGFGVVLQKTSLITQTVFESDLTLHDPLRHSALAN